MKAWRKRRKPVAKSKSFLTGIHIAGVFVWSSAFTRSGSRLKAAPNFQPPPLMFMGGSEKWYYLVETNAWRVKSIYSHVGNSCDLKF
jgi:hypothetical protein